MKTQNMVTISQCNRIGCRHCRYTAHAVFDNSDIGHRLFESFNDAFDPDFDAKWSEDLHRLKRSRPVELMEINAQHPNGTGSYHIFTIDAEITLGLADWLTRSETVRAMENGDLSVEGLDFLDPALLSQALAICLARQAADEVVAALGVEQTQQLSSTPSHWEASQCQ